MADKPTPNLDKLGDILISLGETADISQQRSSDRERIFFTVTFRRDGAFWIGQGATVGEAIERATTTKTVEPAEVAALEMQAA